MKYAILQICLILIFPSLAEAKYVRKEWKHWIDLDKNCLNTREEILKARSKTPIISSKKGCKIKGGTWDDYYYPEIITDIKQADVDHLVPLKHAYDSGGADWSKEKKEKFANDPENLVITNKKYNRSKGAKGIDKWLPINREYACRYIKHWMRIKNKYRLSLSESEIHSFKTIQQSCQK
jgi:hypothetical protein